MFPTKQNKQLFCFVYRNITHLIHTAKDVPCSSIECALKNVVNGGCYYQLRSEIIELIITRTVAVTR